MRFLFLRCSLQIFIRSKVKLFTRSCIIGVITTALFIFTISCGTYSIIIIRFVPYIWIINLRCLSCLLHIFPHIILSLLLRTLLLLISWCHRGDLISHIRDTSLHPVLFHIGVTLLIAAITIVFLLLFFFILVILISFIYKCSLGSVLVVQVLETLIINSHLKHLPMLDYIQTMVSNVEGILKWCAKLLCFEDKFSIFVYALFPTQMTAYHFYCYHYTI